MRSLLVLLALVGTLLVTTPALSASLGTTDILAAHRSGASEATLAGLVAAAESVAPVSSAEIAALRDAAVPESVIRALLARAPIAAAAVPDRPDDPRLVDVVRLVRAGLSETLVAEQIRRSGETYNLTVNDLIYLKGNQVTEAIIGALLSPGTVRTTGGPGTATTTGSGVGQEQGAPTLPLPDLSFEPLTRVRGFLKANVQGSLALKGERLEWYEPARPERNFSIMAGALKSVWLECEPRPDGNYCDGLGIETVGGDTHRFLDVNRDAGGAVQTQRVYESLKARFPQIVFHQKVSG